MCADGDGTDYLVEQEVLFHHVSEENSHPRNCMSDRMVIRVDCGGSDMGHKVFLERLNHGMDDERVLESGPFSVEGRSLEDLDCVFTAEVVEDCGRAV